MPQRSSKRISTSEKNSLRAQKEKKASIHNAKVKENHSDTDIVKKNTQINLAWPGTAKRPLLKYEIIRRSVSKRKNQILVNINDGRKRNCVGAKQAYNF